MNLAVYSRPCGSWLLVPDYFLPSQMARALFGPLAYRGDLSSGTIPGDIWNRVLEEFETHGYAEVTMDTAARLFIRGTEL